MGDFLHYITRLDGFMRSRCLEPSQLHVFVESSAPNQLVRFLSHCVPDLAVTLLPGSLHWTRADPLINPWSEAERMRRPAARLVAAACRRVEDWFIPALCAQYEPASDRVRALRPERTERRVVLLARDKGAIWWPHPGAVRAVLRLTPGFQHHWVGTDGESPDVALQVTTLDDALAAMRFVATASLLVGEDTGLATLREILGLPNFYCVAENWRKTCMEPYGYTPAWLFSTSSSGFATTREQLESGLAARWLEWSLHGAR